jgi:hypothetical protein
MDLLMTDEERKEAMELFIRAVQAAPGSFITSLSEAGYAKQLTVLENRSRLTPVTLRFRGNISDCCGNSA